MYPQRVVGLCEGDRFSPPFPFVFNDAATLMEAIVSNSLFY